MVQKIQPVNLLLNQACNHQINQAVVPLVSQLHNRVSNQPDSRLLDLLDNQVVVHLVSLLINRLDNLVQCRHGDRPVSQVGSRPCNLLHNPLVSHRVGPQISRLAGHHLNQF